MTKLCRQVGIPRKRNTEQFADTIKHNRRNLLRPCNTGYTICERSAGGDRAKNEKEVAVRTTSSVSEYSGYTSPENPMNAMARMPAVMSAMGTPRKAPGTSSKSRRSRIPAKSTSARAKPRAVATE